MPRGPTEGERLLERSVGRFAGNMALDSGSGVQATEPLLIARRPTHTVGQRTGPVFALTRNLLTLAIPAPRRTCDSEFWYVRPSSRHSRRCFSLVASEPTPVNPEEKSP